jgi:hypothetical protein
MLITKQRILLKTEGTQTQRLKIKQHGDSISGPSFSFLRRKAGNKFCSFLAVKTQHVSIQRYMR